MPKYTMTFNLPEEEADFKTAAEGASYKSVLWELDQWLRSETKHGPSQDWPTLKELEEEYILDGPLLPLPDYDARVAAYFYQKFRDKLWDMLRNEDVSLDP